MSPISFGAVSANLFLFEENSFWSTLNRACTENPFEMGQIRLLKSAVCEMAKRGYGKELVSVWGEIRKLLRQRERFNDLDV